MNEPNATIDTAPQDTPTYTVTLPVFEGPLDLLLHLIERDELDITAVSIAQVAGQYLDYLSKLQNNEPNNDGNALADFLVIAAKLLWIKSRALLPKPPAVEEEEEDPAETLAQQLREYKRFKLAAQALREREESSEHMYVRVATPVVLPPRKVGAGEGDLAVLLRAIQRALIALPPTTPAGSMITPLPFTVHDKINLVTMLTTRGRRVGFQQLLETANSRVEIVITLLALLELMKQRRVVVAQDNLFGDITIAAVQGDPTETPS